MANNPNEINEFDQLMIKYLKGNERIINKYDYNSPLKEISPIEPLIFQNDILSNNNNIQNYPVQYNNDINKNIPNNLSQRSNLYDNNELDNKFITPSKPINKNISNINSFINSSIEREKQAKEEKKKKQLEYQRMLDEQIKEKKIRQKKEKEKRMQEELKFEEKIKLENEKFQQEQNKIKNKNRNNIFSEEPQINNVNLKGNPMSSKNLMMDKNNLNKNCEEEIEDKAPNEFMNNVLRRNKSQPYLEVMDNNIFEINKNQKYHLRPQFIGGDGAEPPENLILQNQNPSQNIPQQQIPIERLVSTSSQIPAQFLNPNNHQYKTQNNYYPANRQNQNLSQNMIQNLNNMNYPPQSQPPQADLSPYMTQRQYYDYRQKMNKVSSELGSNTNASINPSNFPTCYQIPFNNNLMNSSPNPVNFNNNSQNVNEFLNMNMNNQNYFGKIMEIFFNEQKKILDSYKETIEKLKSERDEAIYKNKANEEKILALQKMQNDQEILEKNLGYFPFKHNYQQNMEKTLDSIMQKNDDYNYNNENKNNLNENKKVEQSLNNINNNSNISDSKLASLITSTKFVKVNPNGDNKHLLETWKKEDRLENDFEDKKNNKEEFKNKFKLSGMDTNAFMERINQINNNILEPPDDPQNYLNDNNISIISKTQKNDDKSFANEISNRNEKEEISNINNEKISTIKNNEIGNNRDSDLSARKFMAELQSKDFILNNVHNPVMQNLDNNISISTQIKERIEEKKRFEINKNKKIDIISEKESNLSHNIEEDEEKKKKYQNYVFKEVNCSISKKNEEPEENLEEENVQVENIQVQKIQLNPNLKNIDNNVTISNSKKNYSLLVSRHTNTNNNDNDKEKNPFENIVSLNDEEDKMNNKNSKINEKSQEIEEEINDMPNLDSPRNNNKLAQVIDIEKNVNNINNNTSKVNNNENDNINSKELNKNEKEIMERLNFFDDDNIISSKIKLNKKESNNNKFNNINLDINDSYLKENKNVINNNNNISKNNLNEVSKHSNRPPSDLTGDKIASLNNLYDQFVKKKKDQINETNNSIVNNNIENNSLLNESLNTFTQNLNKKWKDLTNKDLNIIKSNREQHYNEDNNYENNVNYLDDDKLEEDEKIFDKVNQFTRVALNELKQSQLSVFSKGKTIKNMNK